MHPTQARRQVHDHSQRCREGKIVVITEYYLRGDPRWRYYVPHEYDVVIRSLGSPLRDTLGGYEQEGPFFSGNLRKMPDVKEDESVLVEVL